MKTENKTTSHSYTEYTCEICNKKSSLEYEISKCELQHKCKHDRSFDYSLEGFDEAWEDYFEGVFIYKKCSDCGTENPTQILKKSDDQKILKLVYDVIKENKVYAKD